MPAAPEPVRPTPLAAALGLFVAVQFAAVFADNLLTYVKETRPDVATTPAAAATHFVTQRYLEATGQIQWWAMFESGYMRNSVTWDVRIELPDGRVERVQSVARGPDDVAIWNFAAKHNRRFVYESTFLGLDLTLPNDVPQNELADETRDAFVADVRKNNLAYEMLFRSLYERVRRTHPDWPDAPAIMEMAVIRVPIRNPRGDNDTLPQTRYVARWRPGGDPRFFPVEAYDLRADGEPWRRFAP